MGHSEMRRGLHPVHTIPGSTAYWILWCSGSAVMSILGVMYENRSLVAMAETLKERDPGWNHRFASDLDCLDQYNLLWMREWWSPIPSPTWKPCGKRWKQTGTPCGNGSASLTGYDLNEPAPEISSSS